VLSSVSAGWAPPSRKLSKLCGPVSVLEKGAHALLLETSLSRPGVHQIVAAAVRFPHVVLAVRPWFPVLQPALRRLLPPTGVKRIDDMCECFMSALTTCDVTGGTEPAPAQQHPTGRCQRYFHEDPRTGPALHAPQTKKKQMPRRLV